TCGRTPTSTPGCAAGSTSGSPRRPPWSPSCGRSRTGTSSRTRSFPTPSGENVLERSTGMRTKWLWLALALLATLALVAAGEAQPPGKGKGKKGGPGKKGGGPGFGRGISEDQIVERLLSFDKNNDGVITKEELPERLQSLIEKGDTNKDGALDKEEIRKLA